MCYFTLYPITRRELRRAVAEPPFLASLFAEPHLPGTSGDPVTEDEVLAGGLPPACLGEAEWRSEWFRGYVQTYIERDVRQLSQITDMVSFRVLTQLAAQRTAQVLSVSGIARDAGLNSATAGRYLSLLEASFLITRVQPYLKSRNQRLIKSPKIYFSDSGLAAHLVSVNSLMPGQNEVLRGALFETYVAQNLLSLLETHLPDAALCFWHEQGRHEVDFVVENGGKCIAIEVKAASRWTNSDLSGLHAFLDRTPQCIAAILAYNGREAVSLGDRLFVIPMGMMLG